MHALATAETSYSPSCMKIRLSDLAKLQPKYISTRVKVDAEHSNVAVVAFFFRECFAATEGWWLRHVTRRLAACHSLEPSSSLGSVMKENRSSLRDISKRLRLWINRHNSLQFIRRGKLYDVTCLSVCPQPSFSKLAGFRYILCHRISPCLRDL